MKRSYFYSCIEAAMLLVFHISATLAQSVENDSLGGTLEAPRVGLFSIPKPQLDRLEAPVAEQMASAQQAFVSLLGTATVADADLVHGYATMGQLYHAYEFFRAAERCYRNASHLAPKEFRWFHLLGVVYQQMGELRLAVQNYKLAQPLRPDYAATFVNLGNAHLQLGEFEAARADFQAILKIDSQLPAALHGMGEVALAAGQYREAIEYFQSTLEKVPGANRIHYSMAMAYRGLGELEQAQAHLDQRGSVGIRPEDRLVEGLKLLIQGERVYLIQGRMAMSAGRYAEAAAAFRKAIEADPKSVRAHINLGVAVKRMGDTERAIKQFRTALSYDPSNQSAHFNLATEFLLTNELDKASQHFYSVLAIDSQDLEALRMLAKVLLSLDRADEAVIHLERLVDLVPDNEEALIDFCQLLIRRERHKEARALLAGAHRRHPDRGITAHALARLLASCPDTSLRDGKLALDLATKVYDATQAANHAQTLAMALAEVGRCDDAATLQRTLIAAAQERSDDALVSLFKKDLNRYEKGAPCRPAVRDVK